MSTEEKLTITERAPDGSETTIEITARTVDADEVEEKGLLERVVDAIFDRSGDDAEEDAAGAHAVIEIDQSTANPAAPVVIVPDPSVASPLSAGPTDTHGTSTADVAPGSEAVRQQEADAGSAAVHADTARDAQAAADAFVASGDYRAAADARQTAESASWEAGDSSMLGAYDAQDLAHAADRQEQVRAYRDEQAEKIERGDYEGAREAAMNAGYATRDADALAGGADHSGQSGRDVANLDWANWQEKNAQENAQHAQSAAAEGDAEKAQMYADHAASQQAVADDFAERADPASIMQDHDPSSVVDTGGSYDATLASVDTGFDSPVDTGTSSFDSTTDDVV